MYKEQKNLSERYKEYINPRSVCINVEYVQNQWFPDILGMTLVKINTGTCSLSQAAILIQPLDN